MPKDKQKSPKSSYNLRSRKKKDDKRNYKKEILQIVAVVKIATQF